MTSTTTPNTLQTKQKQLQQQKQKQTRPLLKRKEGQNGRGNFGIKKCPHILAFNMIPILLCLCWLPDFIVALKDVSVTIPQAVKRGSNAMLTCNYDMENDTLYSVKWYKGRREFYRYTPKENPAMKVFPSQSGLNVERNLSNQSHVVLLAVPLNISGKFTCEISVEAPSFQTAMVSGDMEVVELPEEQATVTGIQPRYRIGDLVDGNCSIKYSKPAANLTWTINGIVVPPHHIKTYQIEKYAETNLESVMSAVHFMVTNQHFIKAQMRLKCTASIFDIFKEEIESIIEEDRPRIMASGQSYPPDHGYGTHGDTDGYEHNESYLTYFSAPKSSAASRASEFIVDKMIKRLKQKLSNYYQLLITFNATYTRKCIFAITLVNNMKNIGMANNFNTIEITYGNLLQVILMRFIAAVLFLMLFSRLIKQSIFRNEKTQDKQMADYNFIAENLRRIMKKQKQEQQQYNFSLTSLWHKTLWKIKENEQQTTKENCYQDKNAKNDVCQTKCGQQQQHQYEKKQYLVLNQNVVNATEKILSNATNMNRINTNKKTIVNLTTAIDCQYHMSQTYAAFATLSPTAFRCPPIHLPVSSLLSSTTTTSKSSSSSASFYRALGYRKKCAHDSFPLYNVDAYKSNNAKYMSKDQTLLMTFTVTAAKSIVDVFAVAVAPLATLAISNPLYKTQSAYAYPKAISLRTSLELKLLSTSVYTSLPIVEMNSFPYFTTIFYKNNYLMAFISELLLHQC